MIPYPFSEAELFEALSLVMPEPQAKQLAGAAVRPSEDVIGWGIPMETLILLSLASPGLEDKMEGFRRQYWPGLDPETWSRKREEMRRAIAAGE